MVKLKVTYPELLIVTESDLFAGMRELIDEEKFPEAMPASPAREAEERQGGEEGKRGLSWHVVGPGVIGVAG